MLINDNFEQPTVSVYIPTYNRCNLLKRAVTSVLEQTWKALEVIVVDDCSTDSTPDYLAELEKNDSRVKWLKNDENSGANVSRNTAIQMAQGKFITGLDDDDYFYPNRIQNFLEFHYKRPESEVLFSNYFVLNSSHNLLRRKKPSIVTQKNLTISNYIGNQVFCRTSLLRDNLFDPNLGKLQDLDCWYRLLNHRVAVNVQKYDYVVDLSHEHERITNSNTTNHSINFLNMKYNSNFDTHILNYPPTKKLSSKYLSLKKVPGYRQIGVLLIKYIANNIRCLF
jgi:glycosyltransferase involved in cell wall biosynthesis